MRFLAPVLSRSIARIAQPGQITYTERQLYYEFCRTLLPNPGLATRPALRGAAIGLLPALWNLRQPRRALHLAAADMLIVGMLRMLRAVPFTLRPPLGYAHFAALLQTYSEMHGRPAGLLCSDTSPSLNINGDLPDLTDYGLPYLLICQHADLVQMLLANHFHIETRCAILSLPAATPLPETLRAMLLRTPGARVYLLHDAGCAGIRFVTRLREQLDLPASIPTIAMGLRPAHALRMHLFALPASGPELVQKPDYLSTREWNWLKAGWCAEIAAIRPARLLLALRRIVLGIAPPALRLPEWRRERAVGFMTWPEGR